MGRGRTTQASHTITPSHSLADARGPALAAAGAGRHATGAGGGGIGTGGAAAAAASEPAAPADVQRAAGMVQEGLAEDRALADRLQQQQLREWPEPEDSYVDDPAAFQREYRAAQRRREAGEEPVPYMREDATGGLGARDGGRPFGLELEFDLPGQFGAQYQRSLRAIGRDLWEAGLTRTEDQRGYGSSRRAGYTDRPGGWSFETDATVAGEVVSPIMYDEPQTWENLEKVCEIIRRHGGQASYRTGGHIHVGLPDYDHTVEHHARLLGLAEGYEDELYRVAANPAARGHRGIDYCQPNRGTASGYRDVSDVRANHHGHHVGVNFQSVSGTSRDHVEFRMWDGSLNPGVIQTQVKLSLGLTAAASRGATPASTRSRIGSHRRNSAGRRLTGESWREQTSGFRHLVDTVFTRARDKAQATALFAVTPWSRG